MKLTRRLSSLALSLFATIVHADTPRRIRRSQPEPPPVSAEAPPPKKMKP